MVLAAMHTHMHRRMQTKYAYIYRHMHTDISIAFDSRIFSLGGGGAAVDMGLWGLRFRVCEWLVSSS